MSRGRGRLRRWWASLLALLVALGDLARAWWSMDRIRVSPREGQLLRLGPGSVIIAGTDRWVVRGREVDPTSAGRLVRYRCGGDDSDVTLSAIGVEHGNGVLLTRSDGRVFLAGEVEVFAKEIG